MAGTKDEDSRTVEPREEDADLDQIVERLAWTPRERLQYLLEMLDFEEKARHATLIED